MLFPTLNFALFLAGLLLLMFFVRRSEPRKIILLLASYLFYMAWNPAFLLLILAISVIDWFAGQYVYREQDQRRRRLWMIVSLTTNLGILAFFKYTGFLSASLLYFFNAAGLDLNWEIWSITLPVGISFYTFQSMSYAIDIYRGKLKPAKTPLDFALFVAFFPHEVAGPIVRAAEFLPQLYRPIHIRLDPSALTLIASGMVKKVVVADNLAPYVDAVFSAPERFPSLAIVLATIAFSTQIYCDFSGYTDMAIGIARLFGLQFPKNFDRPYFATNPSDFWARWHITLSAWLRDYLYISLGGNRGGRLRTYRNLMLTMLLGGLWHGAAWNFVLWGGWHGLLLIVHRVFALPIAPGSRVHWLLSSRPARLASWVLMQYCVLLSWIMFRISDTAALGTALRKFVLFDGRLSLSTPPEISIGLVLGLLFWFWLFHFIFYVYDFKAKVIGQRLSYSFAFVAVCTALLFVLWPGESAPFIYFQF